MDAIVSPEIADRQDVPPIPVRMPNEYVYCPRLAYLMWVQREFAESADTVEGKLRHRRVDRPGAPPPEAEPCAVTPEWEDAATRQYMHPYHQAAVGRGDSNFMNPYAGYLLEMIVDGKNGDVVLYGSGADGDIGKREGAAATAAALGALSFRKSIRTDVSAITASPVVFLLLLHLELVKFLGHIRNFDFPSQLKYLAEFLFPHELLHGGDDSFGLGLLASQFLNLGKEIFRYVQCCTHMLHLHNAHLFLWVVTVKVKVLLTDEQC